MPLPGLVTKWGWFIKVQVDMVTLEAEVSHHSKHDIGEYSVRRDQAERENLVLKVVRSYWKAEVFMVGRLDENMERGIPEVD